VGDADVFFCDVDDRGRSATALALFSMDATLLEPCVR
jgi:hypothetical protein